MGQAKRRETFEQRLTQALKGNEVVKQWLEDNKDKSDEGKILYKNWKHGIITLEQIRRLILKLKLT